MLLLALAPAIGLGIARFGYSLLLPEMSRDLSWSYSQAGWMNTVNAAGYLVGAVVTAPIVKRSSLPAVLKLGVFLTVLAVLLTGLTHNFALLSAFRFMAGVTGALSFVAGGAIAASLASQSDERSGIILSLFYAGPGIGIIASGISIPAFIQVFGGEAWSLAWVLIGTIALLFALLFLKVGDLTFASHASSSDDLPRFLLRNNVWVLAGYLSFGAGYIGYMTFMFTYLKQSGASTIELSVFWASIGFASMTSPWLWSSVMTKFTGGWAMTFLTFITLVGAALPLLSTSGWVLWLSAAVFGCAFFSVPAATTAFAKRNANASQWPFAIGVFTVVFGAGQVVGPTMIGAISDNAGSLFTGLIWGCVFLGLGALLPMFQRDAVATLKR